MHCYYGNIINDVMYYCGNIIYEVVKVSEKIGMTISVITC